MIVLTKNTGLLSPNKKDVFCITSKICNLSKEWNIIIQVFLFPEDFFVSELVLTENERLNYLYKKQKDNLFMIHANNQFMPIWDLSSGISEIPLVQALAFDSKHFIDFLDIS